MEKGLNSEYQSVFEELIREVESGTQELGINRLGMIEPVDRNHLPVVAKIRLHHIVGADIVGERRTQVADV